MEKGLDQVCPSEQTMLGALIRHTTDSYTKDYQPMGCNMGILPPLDERVKGKQERYMSLAKRGLEKMKEFSKAVNEV